MRFRLFLPAVAVLLGPLLMQAHAATSGLPVAVSPPARMESPSTPDKEDGFTLSKLFDRNLLVIVKPPLPLGVLDERTGGPHRAGIPSEFLTPGDAGVAIHIRW